MKKVYRTMSAGIIFFMSILLVWFFVDGRSFFSFENLIKNRLILFEHISRYPISSILIFLVIYATLMTFALPVTILLTVTAGYLFGPITGTAISIAGATLGALCSFMLIRTWFGELAKQHIAKLPAGYRQWLSYGPYYLFIARCVPIVPFGVATAISAVSGMPLSHFMLATCLGIIPTKLMYIAVGTQCAQITCFDDLFSSKFMVQYFIIAVCATLPLLYKLIYQQKG